MLPLTLAVPLLATAAILTVLLLVLRSPVAITIVAVVASTAGLYFADRLRLPPNLIKIYLAFLFAGSMLMLGRVRGFQTSPWEYLLLVFFFGRLLIDLVRPDFRLRFPFGGVGDGAFLGAAYFYYKKALIARRASRDAIFFVVLLSAVGIALVGLIEAATAHDWFEFSDPRFLIEGRHRANSIFRAPEVFGASMSLGVLVTWLLHRRGRLSAATAFVLGAVFVMAVAASLYRGIWIAFAAAVVFVYLVRSPERRTLRALGRMLAAGTLGLAVVLTAWYVTKGTVVYEERLANPENWESRVIVYQAMARGIAKRPWLGHGTGTVEEYLARSTYNMTDLTTPHNGYLAIAYENGVPFVGLYLAWFLVVVQRSFLRRSEAAVFAGAMAVTILVTDLTMYFPLSFDFHSFIVVISAALATAERAAADPQVPSGWMAAGLAVGAAANPAGSPSGRVEAQG